MYASFHEFSFRGAGVMSCWRGVCRVCRGRTGPWFAEGICQSLERTRLSGSLTSTGLPAEAQSSYGIQVLRAWNENNEMPDEWVLLNCSFGTLPESLIGIGRLDICLDHRIVGVPAFILDYWNSEASEDFRCCTSKCKLHSDGLLHCGLVSISKSKIDVRFMQLPLKLQVELCTSIDIIDIYI